MSQSALTNIVSAMSAEQLLNNINITSVENPRSYKRYIVCASKYSDSIQSLMFERLLSLIPEDGLTVGKSVLIKAVSHNESKLPYIGIIDL